MDSRFLIGLLLCGCTETVVDLRVEAESSLSVDRLRLIVHAEDGSEVYREEQNVDSDFTAVLPVFSRDGSTRFGFVAVALSEGAEVGRVDGQIDFVEDDYREVHIRLCTNNVCDGERCFGEPAALGQGPTSGEACRPVICAEELNGTRCDEGQGVCNEGECCWCYNSAGRCVTRDELSGATCGIAGGTCSTCCEGEACDQGACDAEIKFVNVGSGQAHGCATTDTGDVYCWGSDSVGQLGLGVGDQSLATPRLVGRLGEVSVGGSHTCALGSDLRCWGRNEVGESGAFGIDRVDSPSLIPGPWSMISAGVGFTCGVRVDGRIGCFGENVHRQLGNASHADGPTVREVFTSVSVESVSAGRSHSLVVGSDSLVVGSDGLVYGWGLQVNDGSFESCTPDLLGCFSPAHDPASGGWQSVSAGWLFSCGIDRLGGVDCWGDYITSVFGNSAIYETVAHPNERAFRQVEAGDGICALDEDDVAWCWGTDLLLQEPDAVVPQRVEFGQRWASIGSMTHSTICGIGAGGGVYCWGNGEAGQLGRDGVGNTRVPLPVCISTD